MSNVIRLLLLLLFLFSTQSTVMAVDYAGLCRLTYVSNEKKEAVNIPDGQKFSLKMLKDPKEANVYSFEMQLGNRMGGTMTVTPGSRQSKVYDKIVVGPMYSTEMMPPFDIFRVETAFIRVLEGASTIRLQLVDKKNQLLTIEGSKGKIQCNRDVNNQNRLGRKPGK